MFGLSELECCSPSCWGGSRANGSKGKEEGLDHNQQVLNKKNVLCRDSMVQLGKGLASQWKWNKEL